MNSLEYIIFSLIAIFLGIYEAYDAGYNFFIGNILDIDEFIKAIIEKKISYIYKLGDRFWFFEKKGWGRYSRYKLWQTYTYYPDQIFDFTEKHNIDLISKKYFFSVYWNIFCCFVRFILGLFMLAVGIFVIVLKLQTFA